MFLLLAFTSADIISYKFLEIQSVLSVKKVRITFPPPLPPSPPPPPPPPPTPLMAKI